MVETGVTRRIDELGRIVIPKEIRKNLHLVEGEEMEILVENGNVVFRKFSNLKRIENVANEISKSISTRLYGSAIIIDKERVVACNPKRWDGNNYISKSLLRVLESRTTRTFVAGDCIEVFKDGCVNSRVEIVVPIVVNGDVYGGIVYLTDSEDNLSTKCKMLELSAEILGSFMQ